jgi:hypothetical protein
MISVREPGNNEKSNGKQDKVTANVSKVGHGRKLCLEAS